MIIGGRKGQHATYSLTYCFPTWAPFVRSASHPCWTTSRVNCSSGPLRSIPASPRVKHVDLFHREKLPAHCRLPWPLAIFYKFNPAGPFSCLFRNNSPFDGGRWQAVGREWGCGGGGCNGVAASTQMSVPALLPADGRMLRKSYVHHDVISTFENKWQRQNWPSVIILIVSFLVLLFLSARKDEFRYKLYEFTERFELVSQGTTGLQNVGTEMSPSSWVPWLWPCYFVIQKIWVF